MKFSYCDWLISLSLMFSMFICCSMWQNFLLFKDQIIFYYMYIPHFVYSSFISMPMDIQAVSTFWLMWIMLHWAWECNDLFILNKYPEMGLLVLFFKCWGILLSLVAAAFCISTNGVQGLQFLHILTIRAVFGLFFL